MSTGCGTEEAAIEDEGITHGLVVPFLMVAATSLGLATWQNGGNISGAALRWLVVAVLCVAGAFLASVAKKGFLVTARVPVAPVALMCIGAQFAALIWSPVDAPMGSVAPSAVRMLMIVLALAAVVAGSLCAVRPALGRWSFPLLVVLAGVVGLFAIQKLPRPGIDVLMFQHMSCDALLQGWNPYAIRFPDPYPPAASSMFYGQGVSVDGVLQFGFPYMPLSLILALPGYLLGDVRYAHLLAILGAAVLIQRSSRTQLGSVAATLLLFVPTGPLMIWLGWTESLVVLLLALTVYCQARRPAWMPIAFGLLLASKQYMPALAPLGLLLLPRPWTARAVWDLAWKAGVTWLVVTLPMVLWDVQAFMESAVWLQFKQPYRPDALSFLAWANPADPGKWTWLPFAALLAGLAACVAAGMKGRISFPFGVAVCLLLFFAVNKQAFANYYFLVGAALICAVQRGSTPSATGVPRQRRRSEGCSSSVSGDSRSFSARGRLVGWQAASMFGGLFLLNIALMPADMLPADPAGWFAEARMLVSTGSLAIPVEVRDALPTGLFIENPRDGLLYSKYGIASSLAVVPPEAIAHWVGADGGEELLFINVWQAAVAAALGMLLFLVSGLYTSGFGRRAVYVIACCYCTFLWFYIRAQGTELYQALYFTLWYYCAVVLWRENDGMSRLRRNLITGGMWFSCLLLVHTRPFFIPFVISTAILLVVSSIRKHQGQRVAVTLAWVVLSAIGVTATAMASNWHKFGTIASTGYHVLGNGGAEASLGRIGEAIGFLTHPYYSVLLAFPVFTFGMIGLIWAWEKHSFGWLLAAAHAVPIALISAAYGFWAGEWSEGPRYLLFALPVLSLPVLSLFECDVPGRIPRRLALAGVTIVLAFSGVCWWNVISRPMFAWYEIVHFPIPYLDIGAAEAVLARHRGLVLRELDAAITDEQLDSLVIMRSARQSLSAEAYRGYREHVRRWSRGNNFLLLAK